MDFVMIKTDNVPLQLVSWIYEGCALHSTVSAVSVVFGWLDMVDG